VLRDGRPTDTRKSAQAATKLIRKTVDLNFNNMFPLLMPVTKLRPVCILGRRQRKHSFQARNPQSEKDNDPVVEHCRQLVDN
jgi:hypothetical protein